MQKRTMPMLGKNITCRGNPQLTPQASIIKDFYYKCDVSERPKIFGMTASPVDAKVNLFEASRSVGEGCARYSILKIL